MRKGTKIYNVDIAADGTITAMDASCNAISLTRSQRNVLSNYKRRDYIEAIKKEFGKDVIHPNFTVSSKGEIVYTYTN